MREVKMNRVPFNPDGNNQPSNNNGRVPFNPAPQLREGDTNIVVPKYKTPKDLEIDKALDFIQQNSRRNMRDDEKQILRSMMRNPSTPKGELSDAIVTLQGLKAKQIDNTITTPDYYMKRSDSGNYVPVALEQGEKIPPGYKAASLWGTQESANDDEWYTDLGKSLANGVIKLGGGVVDLAQTGVELVTGEESELLRSGQNSFQALEFNKDKSLNRPVYDVEGIETFADLFDKKRVDLGPEALWGTLNMTAESLTEFGLGTLTGANFIKAGKALKYGYKGIAPILELNKAGKLVDVSLDLTESQISKSIFIGSFLSQIGGSLDEAEEAGLKGRDKAFAASAITALKATIDAKFGLDGKIMSELFKKSEKEVFKKAMSKVVNSVERDAVTGTITSNGAKQLIKDAGIGYAELAKNGAKEIVKDALGEGTQEAAQDFVGKAAEQLWDKLTPEERGRYGTDALSAKSFGEYFNSFATGAISGGPMAIASSILKDRNEQQSINAYERVKEGPQAVQALKTDLNNALEKGEITQSEHEQAMFKIDKYDSYHQETKDANLLPEDEKRAFELSFQIEGLKTEIPTNENEISKLLPIERAKVEGKQSQTKALQKELNEIIERGQVAAEAVVAKKIEEKLAKEKEKQVTENAKESNSKLNQKESKVKQPKEKVVKVDLEEGEGTTEIKVGSEYVKEPKLPEQPALKDETRTYDTIDNETFNHTKFPSRTKFQMVVDKLSKWQNKEMLGVIKKKSYKYYDKKTKSRIPNSILEVELEDGKRIRFASSMYYNNKNEEGFRSHTRNERLLGNEEGVPVGLKLIDINNPKGLLAEGEYTPGKKVLKIYNKRTGQFLSWAKETHKGKSDSKKADGSLVTTAEEGDILKTLEGQDYNESTKGNEGDIARIISPKPKPTPTEKAKEATEKIVEEGKSKVKQQKEVVSKKETTEPNGLSIRIKIESYNQLSKAQKKSELGVRLRKEIQTETEEFGGSLKPLNKGKVQLLDSEGKQVKKASVKRKQSVIDEEKAIAKKTKDALDATPTSLYQYIAIVVGRGGQFDKSITKEIPDVPSLMKNNKGDGYSLESLYDGYKEESGLDNIDEKDFAVKAENIIGSYLTDGGRGDAIKYAIEAYEKDINGGKTDKELADMIAYGESLGLKEQEVSVIDESVQNLNEEEVKELETKIENTNEKDRNEESANRIIQDIAGEKGSDKSPFDEMESEQDNQEGKDIIRGNYSDDVFQKPAELQYAEGQLKKAEIELTASKKALDAKRKELDRGIVEDREDLFGDRKSTDATSLFDERVDLSAREETLAPFKQRYDNAQKDFVKQTAKVKELQDKGDAQTSLFQKFKLVPELGKNIIQRSIDYADDLIDKKNKLTELWRSELDKNGVSEKSESLRNKLAYFQKENFAVKVYESKQELPYSDKFATHGVIDFSDVSWTENRNVFFDVIKGIYIPNAIGKKVEASIDKRGGSNFLEFNYNEENVKIIESELSKNGFNTASDLTNESLFQKQKRTADKVNIDKVISVLQKAIPKVKIIYDENLKYAGKWSPSTNTITINPFYAGLDTPIHEAGHILIDAMGYNNKVIQSAINQLRNTNLYKETKERYPELSNEELDKEVLAEAIGREGADIFDKVEDRSKFKAYLDYIFDWLKQKLGLDKNIAKSLAKQIIGGIKTKNLEGTNTGKEQFQKTDKEKKKPFAAQALKYNQYAIEEGFDAQKEFDKYEKAYVELKEVKIDVKLAEEMADEAVTEEEIKEADSELEKQRVLLKEAQKEFSIKGKKYLGYLKYKKDFREVQALLEDKDLEDYTYEELNDLSIKLHSFNDRAVKSLKARVHLKIGHKATIKQNEIHKKNEGFIEALGKTSDISPLKRKILHISHFSEKNADIQALALASGKAIIDKLSEANSLKDTHAKLGLKVIQEENRRLGITGTAMNRFSSDSSKYFEWMINEDGEYLTIDEAKSKGLSKAKIDYLDFHRETVAGYRESMSANDYENSKMAAIRVDKNFREAYKSEGLIPAFSYYLGGGATNLGKVRILHNGKVMSYSEIEKEIISSVDKKSIQSIAKALYDLLVVNIKARYQLKKGQNIDEKENPLELKGDAEYSLNEKGQLVSKFDKPRNKDRGYSKDFYKAMNQFIDESAHVKHISKIMPLVEAVEYLNKNGYAEEGYTIKPNVAKWIDDWKALHIFKEPHVNDPIIDAAVKSLRKLVASTTMWFNIPANTINVFMGNYNNWRAENAETLARGNARLFGGKGSRKEVGIVNDYALAIIKKYNLVNQDFDSHPVIKANNVFSKLATWGTQVGEYQIQGSLGLGLLSQEEFDSFEFAKDKYGNNVLTVKKGVDEDKLKSKMTQVKNRVTDIQGKYPDEDRRNIMRGEFGKALFQFKVWMPDWFKERFGARYINAYGQEKEGSYIKMLRVGVKEMKNDLKKGDIKKALTNPVFVQNLKGMATIGALLALKHSGDDDDKKKGGLNWDSALSQVLFIFDLEQDKYMVSNPAAILGKLKDFINAFESLIGFEEDAWEKTKRVLPGNKAITFVENQMK